MATSLLTRSRKRKARRTLKEERLAQLILNELHTQGALPKNDLVTKYANEQGPDRRTVKRVIARLIRVGYVDERLADPQIEVEFANRGLGWWLELTPAGYLCWRDQPLVAN
jgi:hypothetical protein